jgi:hypothetical protein
MAKKTRAEFVAQVTAEIQPTVTTTKHRSVLNDYLATGVIMEKDTVEAITGTSGSLTASFLTATQLTSTITGDADYSISNVEDGGTYKLIINKAAANIVTITGATEAVLGQQVELTEIHLEVWSANSKIYVRQINNRSSGNFAIGDISSGGADIASFSYFTYRINNNICTINAKILLDSGGDGNQVFYFITRRLGNLYNGEDISPYIYDGVAAVAIGQCTITDNGVQYLFNCSLDSPSTANGYICINTSFPIK